ncbi:MAG TPA: tetratricopeptide repeat protein [Thermoanaerobaculia bacterium]|nr:tetratricopeptide repeat protein [Thermoanaerobaculia bacterium]
MKRIAAILFIATLPLAAEAQTNDAQALYQLGRDAMTRGEPEKAAEYVEKAVALKPNDAGYHYQLANAYLQAGMRAGMFGGLSMGRKARAELERAIQLDPNLTPARFALLEFYIVAPAIAGGSESAAMEQATEIRKRDAIDGHRAFARIHTAAKKADLARKEYVDMLKEQPASARAHYFFGVYLMLTEKNYKSAGDEFESAVRLDPSYMPAYFQIGHLAALAANNFARGEETLKKYLAYRPKDEEPSVARAYYWLGGIYEKQGNKAEAKSSYATSLKINPNQKDVDAAMKRVS